MLLPVGTLLPDVRGHRATVRKSFRGLPMGIFSLPRRAFLSFPELRLRHGFRAIFYLSFSHLRRDPGLLLPGVFNGISVYNGR